MKKNVPRFLILALAMTVFTGCGNKSNQNDFVGSSEPFQIGDTGGLELPLDNNNTELTWLVATDFSDMNNKYAVKKIREATGVNIQIIEYPNSTVSEKVKVLIASKNLPDIIGRGINSIDEANALGMEGAFARIDDYFDVMPNYRKLFVENEECDWVFKSYQAPDGHSYLVFGYDLQRDVNHGMLYRKDIFDKHGIEMWNNPEEFYSVLKQLKELYPESSPFTSKNQENIINLLSISWGLNAFNPYYDEEEKIWKYSDTDPTMKEMLDYLKRLYQEELLDPEFLTLTQAAWTSKMTQADKAFTTFDWIGRLDMFKEQTQETVPEYDLRYGNPIGPKGTVITLSKVGAGTPVTKNKNTELSCKLLDFMLSPAGAELSTMGIEGETYVLNENGKASFPEFPEDQKVEITSLEEKYGFFLLGMYKRFDRRSSYFDYTPKEQEAQDLVIKGNRFEPEDPILSFTNEEKELITNHKVKLEEAAKEFFVKYILGNQTGNAAWDEWLAKSKELKVDEIVSVYNQAQERYDALK